MTDIHLNAGDLAAAAQRTRSAATEAGDGGATHITAAAAGMPGSTSAQQLEGMGPDWGSGVDDWRGAAEDFASSLDSHGADMSGTDSSAGGLFAGLTASVSGSAG